MASRVDYDRSMSNMPMLFPTIMAVIAFILALVALTHMIIIHRRANRRAIILKEQRPHADSSS